MATIKSPRSIVYVHEKVRGRPFSPSDLTNIIEDINAGAYSAPQIASFLTASAAHPLSRKEILYLTKAMVDVGPRLEWAAGPIIDKHCVGGQPGNRTTPIVVSILAALGLRIPKTSSRAITSAAGTADVMEVMSPVHLTIEQMKAVVEKTGGCIVWGGAVGLSPVDDELVHVARDIGIDANGQLISSILSKKVAAGSTHLIIDIPFGPTAKLRSHRDARALKTNMLAVASALNLSCCVEITDGSQPVGSGIGPALEARDVIAVLRNSDTAPIDLRNKALYLAGKALELVSRAQDGAGWQNAVDCLSSGQAWQKFQEICAAQGGLRDIATAQYREAVFASSKGTVRAVDNRALVRLAKLAGAPEDKLAGLDLHVKLGARVSQTKPLYTIHSNSRLGLKQAVQAAQTLQPFSIALDKKSFQTIR